MPKATAPRQLPAPAGRFRNRRTATVALCRGVALSMSLLLGVLIFLRPAAPSQAADAPHAAPANIQANEADPKEQTLAEGPIHVRRLRVPADQLQKLIPRDALYLPVNAQEFERRLELARAAQDGRPSARPVRLVEAAYHARFDGHQLVDGTAILQVRRAKLALDAGEPSNESPAPGADDAILPLQPLSLACVSASWMPESSGPQPPPPAPPGMLRPALFGMLPSQGVGVLVERSGNLRLNWTLGGKRHTAGEVQFDFALPSAPVQTVLLDLPSDRAPVPSVGHVTEILAAGGGEVPDAGTSSALIHPLPGGHRRWRVELGGDSRFTLRIVSHPNEKLAAIHNAGDAEQAAARAPSRASLPTYRQHTSYELSLKGAKVVAELRLDAEQEPSDQLIFQASPFLRVVEARYGDSLLAWADAPVAHRDPKSGATRDSATKARSLPPQRLVLQLPAKAPGADRTIRITGVAPLVRKQPWRLPTFRPEGLSWAQGTAELSLPSSLSLEALALRDCRQSEAATFVRPESRRLIRLEHFSAAAEAEVLVARQESRRTVRQATLVEVRGSELAATTVADFRVAAPGQQEAATDASNVDFENFVLSARVSADWTVESVESIPSGAVADWHLAASGPRAAEGVLTIRLDAPLSSGRPLQLAVACESRRSALTEKLPLSSLSPLAFKKCDLLRDLMLLRPAPEEPFRLEIDAATTWIVSADGSVRPLQRPKRRRAAADENAGADAVATLTTTIEPLLRSELTAVDAQVVRPQWTGLLFDVNAEATGQTIRLLQEKPRYTADIHVDATLTGDSLDETYSIDCIPEAARLEKLLVYLSAQADEPLRWSLVGSDASQLTAERLPAEEHEARRLPRHGELWEITLRRLQSDRFQLRAVRTYSIAPTSSRSGQAADREDPPSPDEPSAGRAAKETPSADSPPPADTSVEKPAATRRTIPIALAALPDASQQRGTVSIRTADGTHFLVEKHRLASIPAKAVPPKRYPLERAAYRYDPSGDVLAKKKSTFAITRIANPLNQPLAWVWSAALDSRYQRDGRTSHTAIYDVQNTGRRSVTITVPRDARVQAIWVDEQRIPLDGKPNQRDATAGRALAGVPAVRDPHPPSAPAADAPPAPPVAQPTPPSSRSGVPAESKTDSTSPSEAETVAGAKRPQVFAVPLPSGRKFPQIVVHFYLEELPLGLMRTARPHMPTIDLPVVHRQWRLWCPSGYQVLAGGTNRLHWSQRLFGPFGRGPDQRPSSPADTNFWAASIGAGAAQASARRIASRHLAAIGMTLSRQPPASGVTWGALVTEAESQVSSRIGLGAQSDAVLLLVDGHGLATAGIAPDRRIDIAPTIDVLDANDPLALAASTLERADLALLVTPRAAILTSQASAALVRAETEKLGFAGRLRPQGPSPDGSESATSNLPETITAPVYYVVDDTLARRIDQQRDMPQMGPLTSASNWDAEPGAHFAPWASANPNLSTVEGFSAYRMVLPSPTHGPDAAESDETELAAREKLPTVAVRIIRRNAFEALGWVALVLSAALANWKLIHRPLSMIVVLSGLAVLALLLPRPYVSIATGLFLGALSSLVLGLFGRLRAMAASNQEPTIAEASATASLPVATLLFVAALVLNQAIVTAQEQTTHAAQPARPDPVVHNVYIPIDEDQRPTGDLQYVSADLKIDEDQRPTGDLQYVSADLKYELDRRIQAILGKPRGWMIREATYRGSFARDGRTNNLASARFHATFDLQVFDPTARITLPMARDEVRLAEPPAARLDGQPIEIVRSADGKSLSFVAPRAGEFRLQMALQPAVEHLPWGTVVDLGVPAVPTSRVVLSLPDGTDDLVLPTMRGAVQWDDRTRTLEGDLGAARRLTLFWHNRSVSGDRQTDIHLNELLWMRVKPQGVTLDARMRVSLRQPPAATPPVRLRLEADPRLQLLPLPSDAPFLLLEVHPPLPSDRLQPGAALSSLGREMMTITHRADPVRLGHRVYTLELKPSERRDIDIDLAFQLADTSGVGHLRLPHLRLLRDLDRDPLPGVAPTIPRLRRLLAVSIDPSLRYEVASAEAFESLAPLQFLRAWRSQVEIEPIDDAKTETPRDGRLAQSLPNLAYELPTRDWGAGQGVGTPPRPTTIGRGPNAGPDRLPWTLATRPRPAESDAAEVLLFSFGTKPVWLPAEATGRRDSTGRDTRAGGWKIPMSPAPIAPLRTPSQAEVLFSAQVETTSGHLFEHRIAAPKKLRVDAVSVQAEDAERATRWSRDMQGNIIVFLDRRLSGPHVIALRGRLPIADGLRRSLSGNARDTARRPGSSATDLPLPAIHLLTAEPASREIHIFRQPDVLVNVHANREFREIDVQTPKEATAEVELRPGPSLPRTTGAAEQQAPTESHSFGRLLKRFLVVAPGSKSAPTPDGQDLQSGATDAPADVLGITVTIKPNQPKVSASMITLLGGAGGESETEVHFQLAVEEGLVDVLRFEVPDWWGRSFVIEAAQWDAPPNNPAAEPNRNAVQTTLVRRPGEDRRQLILWPDHPISNNCQIRMRTEQGLSQGYGLRVPEIDLLDVEPCDQFVALPKEVKGKPIEWETSGLQTGDLPPSLADSIGSGETHRVYQATGNDFQATAKPLGGPAGVARVRLLDVRIAWSADGECQGVAAFDLEPTELDRCDLRLPPGYELVQATVAGLPAMVEAHKPQHYGIHLGPQQLPQRIEVVFSGRLEPAAHRSRRDFRSPMLFVNDRPLPVEQSLWTVYAPATAGSGGPTSSKTTVSELRQQLIRLEATASLIDLETQAVTELREDELARWYRPWALRLLAGRRAVNRAAGQGSTDWPDAEVAISDAAKVLEEHQEVARRLGTLALLNQLERSDVALQAPMALWQRWAAMDRTPTRILVQGNLAAITLAYDRRATSDLPGRLAAALLIVAGAVGLVIGTLRNVWHDMTWRWPHPLGFACGLFWWLWLSPPFVGWVLMLISLAALFLPSWRRPLILLEPSQVAPSERGSSIRRRVGDGS